MEGNQKLIDRISTLPDPIIHHIYSFLPSQYLVQSSILSKRFTNLWCSAPTLYLDLEQFRGPNGSPYDQAQADSSYMNDGSSDNQHSEPDNFNYVFDVLYFCRFGDCVMQKRAPSTIEKLTLGWDCGHTASSFMSYCIANVVPFPSHVNAWLDIASRNNLQVVHLDLKFFNDVNLSPSLFTCASLKELRVNLNLNSYIIFPTAMSLSRLKILHLADIKFDDQQSTQAFFSACPVLETLIMNACYLIDHETININAIHLKNLTIYTCGDLWNDRPCTLNVSAPSLEHFKFVQTDAPKDLYEFDFPSVLNVSITIHDGSSFSSLVQILRALENAHTIKLSGFYLQHHLNQVALVQGRLPFSLPNLKSMRLNGLTETNTIPLVLTLLECSPNCESLFIRFNWELNHVERFCSQEESEHISFHHLKFVEIKGFVGFESQVQFVNYLLEKAVALEKLFIFCKAFDDIEKQKSLERIGEELLTSPKASSNAVIVFHMQRRNL